MLSRSMRTTSYQHAVRGGAFGLLLILLGQSAMAQITVLGDLWREKFCKPGDRYVEKVVVQNPTQAPVVVQLFQADLKESLGDIGLVSVGVIRRSNASWITLRNVRYKIDPMSQVALEVPIKVPLSIPPGTYYSALVVQTASPSDQKASGGRIGVAMTIQLCTTISGGKNAIEVNEKLKTKGNELILDVTNTGDNVLILKFMSDDINGRVRIYPGETNRKIINIEKLPDGFYQRRLIFDDEKNFIVPKQVEFRKGKEAPLVSTSGQRLNKFGGLQVALDYGTNRQGVRLLGHLNFGRFSIHGSTSRSEYEKTPISYGSQLYAAYQGRGFSLSAGTFFWGARTFKQIGGCIYFKRVTASLSYSPDYRMTNATLSVGLFNRLSFSAYTIFIQGKKPDAFVSLLISIL